jgi:hypothetical protein
MGLDPRGLSIILRATDRGTALIGDDEPTIGSQYKPATQKRRNRLVDARSIARNRSRRGQDMAVIAGMGIGKQACLQIVELDCLGHGYGSPFMDTALCRAHHPQPRRFTGRGQRTASGRCHSMTAPMLAFELKSSGISRQTEKLRLDFRAFARRVSDMNENTILIRQLCTRAGCIMEDSSVIALIWDDDLSIQKRLAALTAAADDIAALIAAANVLSQR